MSFLKIIEKMQQKQKPYYIAIEDPEKFLEEYMNIYQDEYSKRRASAVIRMFPPSKLTPNTRWLDIGCGGGFYSLAAAQNGVNNIVAVDIHPVCVKATKLNVVRNADLKVDGVVEDATRLPFKRDCFDVVLCVDLIEHLHNDKQLLLDVYSVMKDGGFLIIATQNSSSINYLIEGFLERYVLKNKRWMGWDPTHVRFYNFAGLARLLSESGFKPLKVIGTYFIPYNLVRFAMELISAKFSDSVYKVFLKMNDRLETLSEKPFWKTHGWGVICISKKVHDA